MSYQLKLIKVIFKPLNALVITLIIIIGMPIALYLINPYKVNSEGVRARIIGVDIYRIPSESMKPGLVSGDYILVSNTAYQKTLPKRKDVIVFYNHKSKNSNKKIPYIKRIVAISGDKIKIERGKVIVNDLVASEPYVQEKNSNSQYSQNMSEITVPKGKLFVMGDNRNNSNDSRIFGAISSEKIIGKATSILYAADGRAGGDIK